MDIAKKNLVFFFTSALLFLGGMAEAQQLTRFAVVDLPKVYVAFFRESRAVRDFEASSERVQSEIDRMSKEIDDIKVNLTNAEFRGDQAQALQLETEVNRKTDYLREYYRIKTAELESQKNTLTQSGQFLEQVYDQIRYIAESEGYSMVLNLKENASIIWYSPTVDITDKVIQNLQQASR